MCGKKAEKCEKKWWLASRVSNEARGWEVARTNWIMGKKLQERKNERLMNLPSIKLYSDKKFFDKSKLLWCKKN